MRKHPLKHPALAVAFALWVGVSHAPLAFAQTAVFQNGTAAPFGGGYYTGAQDTMILTNSGGQQNLNFGGRTDFDVGTFNGSGTARHTLIRFDLTSLAGQFSTITGVTLRLTFSDTLVSFNVSTSNTVEVHQVAAANAGWVEGNGSSTAGTGGQSTWDFLNQWPNNPWAGSGGASTPGTDFLAATVASTPWSGAPPVGTTFDLVFTDTSFLSSWISGTNSGLFLKDATENVTAENRVNFYSSEFGTVAFRPELIVTYTAIPEPSSLALLAGLGVLSGRFFLRRKR